MKVYSENELDGILGIVNDPQFNTIRLRITTEPLLPLGSTLVEESAEKPIESADDAQLGGHNQ